MRPRIIVIIPAFNEQRSIGRVVREIPGSVAEIVVVDNASTDLTGAAAREAGATVLSEPTPGYGRACLRGLEYCHRQRPAPDIVVFLDGDHSDYPEELPLLTRPIESGDADLVIGSRVLGRREKGSMTTPQVFGNWLATRLMKTFFKTTFTDLGPFRAIRYTSLAGLDMKDKTYGWTVEMQVKAARKKLRCVEVPVRYRKRIGVSKISGTFRGTIMAGYKILVTIFKNL